MTDETTPPDPAVDRHVAFPELAADAWATTPSQDQPVVGEEPSPLPPREGAGRRSGWGWRRTVAIVALLFFMGNVNNHNSSPPPWPDGNYAQQQSGDGLPDGYDPTTDGWVVDLPDDAAEPLISPDSRVSPAPAGPTVLRVEVVAASPEPVRLMLFTDRGPLAQSSDGEAPVVREFQVGSRTHLLSVRATSLSGASVSMQCRIYAGTTLVAISTRPDDVSCSAQWA